MSGWLDSGPLRRGALKSGRSDDEDLRPGALDDNTAFLQAPFTPEKFARAGRTVLDRSAVRL